MLNKIIKNSLAALLIVGSLHSAQAEELCAEVKIEILQEATLERQGFEAIMRINNGLEATAIDNINITVNFEYENGELATATSDTSSTTAEFFIIIDDLVNIDNCDGNACVDRAGANDNANITLASIAAKTTGEFKWLIIPSVKATDEINGNGVLYFIGATLNYSYGSVTETVEVAKDSIVVKPLPDLSLEYFLTENIEADDPSTAAIIEEAVPYTLGVRMTNSGKGTAKQVKIESAQPVIVANEIGLAIDFKILESYLEDEPAEDTLLIDFGDLPADDVKVGRWVMTSTFSGIFTSFNASISHAPDLGGSLTSIFSPVVKTHLLVRDVRLAGGDSVKDFLAWRGTDLYVFESEPAANVIEDDNGTPNDPSDDINKCEDCAEVDAYDTTTDPGDGIVFPACSPVSGYCAFTTPTLLEKEYAYFKIRAADGLYHIDRVVDANNNILPTENAWYSWEDADGGTKNHFYNIFDVTGSTSYKVYFKGAVDIDAAPLLSVNPSWTTTENQQLGFLVKATDPNGTIPNIYAEVMPAGATFTDKGDGSGVFSWVPFTGQAGNYRDVRFGATDGNNASSATVTIDVYAENDSDNDQIDDEWELEHYGDLDSLNCPSALDSDGDGVTDCQEYLDGTDPHSNVVANTDYVVMWQGESISIDVAHLMENDNSSDEVALSVTGVTAQGAPQILNISGTTIIFKPAADLTGVDSFTYTLSGESSTTEGTVDITVIASGEMQLTGTNKNELLYSQATKEVVPNGGTDKIFGSAGIDTIYMGHGMGTATLYTTGDTEADNAVDIIALAADVPANEFLLQRVEGNDDLALTLNDSYTDRLIIQDFYLYGLNDGERPLEVRVWNSGSIKLDQVWAPDINVQMHQKNEKCWWAFVDVLASYAFNPLATGNLIVGPNSEESVGPTAESTCASCGYFSDYDAVFMCPVDGFIGSKAMEYALENDTDPLITSLPAALNIDIISANTDLIGTATLDLLFAADDGLIEGGMGPDIVGSEDADGDNNDAATYLYGLGGGADTFIHVRGDILRFKAGINPSDLVFYRDMGSNLFISIVGSPGDVLYMPGYFKGGGWSGIDPVFDWNFKHIEFVDHPDVVWDSYDIYQFSVQGTADDDTLWAQWTDDELNGFEGDDFLYGNSGDDRLFGHSGDDWLSGGDGDDYLSGGEGSDIYYYDARYETYRINNLDYSEGHEDVLEFALNIKPEDVALDRINDDLVIRIAGEPDAGITVMDFFLDPEHTALAKIKFHYDNSEWLLTTLAINDYIATPIDGGAVHRIDYDDLTDNDFDLEGDELSVVKGSYTGVMGGTISDGGNIIGSRYINFTPTSDSVDAAEFIYDVTDGTTVHRAKVYLTFTLDGTPIIGPDSASSPSTNNDEILYGTDNAETFETFNGGPGNDLLFLESGADTVLFGKGDGDDLLTRLDGEASATTLQFKADVSEFDVGFSRDLYDLVIDLNGNDTLRIDMFYWQDVFAPAFSGNIIAFSALTFTDEPNLTWDHADVLGFASPGESTADTLAGSSNDDTLFGGAGNDTVSGYAGEDILYGEDDNDALFGGADDDYLFGDNGNDVLNGGTGDDYLFGGTGDDTYEFVLGDGEDTIDNTDFGSTSAETPGDILSIYQWDGAPGGTKSLIAESDLIARLTADGEMEFSFVSSPGDKITSLSWDNWFFDVRLDGIQVFDAILGSKIISPDDIEVLALAGTAGDDVIYGVAWGESLSVDKDDTLYGLAGDDTIYGLAGDDVLSGGADKDTLYGGEGIDTLEGGAGNDTLDGGGGVDTYLYSSDALGVGLGNDTIISFEDGSVKQDRIHFEAPITPNDLSVIKTGNDLVITVGAGETIITVTDHYLSDSHGVYEMYFELSSEVCSLLSGAIDCTFATYGKTGSIRPVGGWDGSFASVFWSGGASGADHDGKILVVGKAPGGGDRKADFSLTRYNVDGSVDGGFDDGNADHHGFLTDVVFEETNLAQAVTQDPDGNIISAGYSGTWGNNRPAIARYSPAGIYDDTALFATDIDIYADPLADPPENELIITDSMIYSVTVHSFDNDADGYDDHHVVAAGFVNIEGKKKGVLMRFLPSGVLDPAFNGNGIKIEELGIYNNEFRAVTVQADKYVVGGRVGGKFVLARYNSDGTLDTSFGEDAGKTFTTTDKTTYAYSMAVQDDGKFVLAGIEGTWVNPNGWEEMNVMVVRYNTDGTEDDDFGTDSIQIISDPTLLMNAKSVAIAPNGDIVVAGYMGTYSGAWTLLDILVARLKDDGTLDTSFATNGIQQTDVYDVDDDDLGYSVLVDDTGKILVTGMADDSNNVQNSVTLRYLP